MKTFHLTYLLICLAGLVYSDSPTPYSEIRKDVAYRETDPQNKMDLYYPQTGSRPHPTHIYIHGGGWTGGSKNIGSGSFATLFGRLAKAGFMGISVEYRKVKADQNVFMRESTVDALDAIRYVFAHAEALGVDTNNVFLWGTSAGGHLALMGATAVGNKQLSESPDLKKIPVSIKGVLAWFPPCDMMNYEAISVEKNGKLRPLSNRMGRRVEDEPEAFMEISPLNNLTADCPPVLIFHGNQDTVVHAEHSFRFKQRADESGVDCTLQIVENAQHGFRRDEQSGNYNPSLDMIEDKSVRFFVDRVTPPSVP